MKVKKGVLVKVEEKDIELLEKNPDIFWKGVKEIGKYAFKEIKNLSKIDIPSSVKKIEFGAFLKCYNLSEVKLNENIEFIGAFAFGSCESLREIIIPKSLKIFGVDLWGCGIFADCPKLQKITFKNKNEFPKGFKYFIKDFNFDSFLVNGEEVTFLRDVENNNDKEDE